MKKLFLTADDLLIKSYELARKVYFDNYFPTHLIGLWRGGTPIAIAIHEFLHYTGIRCFHKPIKTTRVFDKKDKCSINIIGFNFVLKVVNKHSRLLFVDDIFDTGNTMNSLYNTIKQTKKNNMPQIKIATIFYKPEQNKTELKPDYYIEETDKWVVYPHEITDLTENEIKKYKPHLYKYIKDIKHDGLLKE
jgi:hypothetical protein